MWLTHGQAKIKNGKRKSKAYAAYHNAEQRCNNEKHTAYENYGGRGIRFKFSSFEQFFAELGNPPKGMTLDRKNNEGHYEPGNVHWATHREQNLNQRVRKDNSLGYRGIDYRKDREKFRVRIDGKFLGYFNTLEEAITLLEVTNAIA